MIRSLTAILLTFSTLLLALPSQAGPLPPSLQSRFFQLLLLETHEGGLLMGNILGTRLLRKSSLEMIEVAHILELPENTEVVDYLGSKVSQLENNTQELLRRKYGSRPVSPEESRLAMKEVSKAHLAPLVRGEQTAERIVFGSERSFTIRRDYQAIAQAFVQGSPNNLEDPILKLSQILDVSVRSLEFMKRFDRAGFGPSASASDVLGGARLYTSLAKDLEKAIALMAKIDDVPVSVFLQLAEIRIVMIRAREMGLSPERVEATLGSRVSHEHQALLTKFHDAEFKINFTVDPAVRKKFRALKDSLFPELDSESPRGSRLLNAEQN